MFLFVFFVKEVSFSNESENVNSRVRMTSQVILRPSQWRIQTLSLGMGRGGGLDFLAQLAFFPSVISSFFAQNKGRGLP